MFRYIAIALFTVSAMAPAFAAEPITSIGLPKFSCRVASCDAIGTVQLAGTPGALVPAGAELRRWDGATFVTAQDARVPATVQISSSTAIYDVPVGEELKVTNRLDVTTVVTGRVARYAIGNSAGPVQFSGATVNFYADGTVTPASLSISYSDDYPVEFLRAVRQYKLTRSFFSGARNRGFSAAALADITLASLTAPRPAIEDGTREAVTGFAYGDPTRAYYQAPNYTEERIAGAMNTRQSIEVCGLTSTGPCYSRVAYVRPVNLDTVYLHCRNGGAGIDGNCPWLQAHDFVRQYGVALGGAGRCLADSAEPQRVFFGYTGDAFVCQTTYGGDVLPREAEDQIFDRALLFYTEGI